MYLRIVLDTIQTIQYSSFHESFYLYQNQKRPTSIIFYDPYPNNITTTVPAVSSSNQSSQTLTSLLLIGNTIPRGFITTEAVVVPGSSTNNLEWSIEATRTPGTTPVLVRQKKITVTERLISGVSIGIDVVGIGTNTQITFVIVVADTAAAAVGAILIIVQGHVVATTTTGRGGGIAEPFHVHLHNILRQFQLGVQITCLVIEMNEHSEQHEHDHHHDRHDDCLPTTLYERSRRVNLGVGDHRNSIHFFGRFFVVHDDAWVGTIRVVGSRGGNHGIGG